MTETKIFHISDVLSITTGRLVAEEGMPAIYRILNWMSGKNLMTHQLPRVAEEAEPVLSAIYPHLSKDALSSDIDELDRLLANTNRKTQEGSAVLKSWLDGLAARFGSEFAVPKLN